MKERIRPSPEAVERIRKVGEREVLAFLDQISLGSVRNLSEHLPTVHGFRPRSEAGLKQQKSALAKRVVNRTGGTDRDQHGLYVMWRAWAWEKLGDADATEHILDALEQAIVSSRTPDERSAETNRAATLSFVEALKELSADNKCSRETIERLLKFSPLSLDDSIQKVVASCKAAKDIERDAAISNLPDRLKEDEQAIQTIRDRVAALASDVASLQAQMRGAPEWQDQLQSRLGALSELVAGIQQQVGHVEGAVSAQNEGLLANNTKLQEFEGRVGAAISESRETIELCSSLVEPVEKQVRELKAALEAIPVPIEPDAFAKITHELDALGARVGLLSEASENAIKSLVGRLNALEQRAVHANTAAPATRNDPPASELLPITKSQFQLGGTPRSLGDAGEIVSAIATGLQSIGLKKSAAQTFAEEVSASILAGQVVFVKGALATEVVRVCAFAVSGSLVTAISIPIGLVSGALLSRTVDSVKDKSSTNVPSIVLEGVNRSALDVIKEALQAVQGSQAAAQSPTFCFASVLSGMASLPVEPEHLEIGSVFDVDYLEWRLLADAPPSLAGGAVACDNLRKLRAEYCKGSGEALDEALRVLREFTKRRNPLIERNVAAAISALTRLRGANPSTSPMQSMAFGWFMPLWVALGISKESVDSELDGGKCDSDKPDARLAAMLATESFGAAAPGSGA